MTYKEAIELTEDSGTLLDSDSKTRHEWEKLVIKALELRINKPAVIKNNMLTCINCGEMLDIRDDSNDNIVICRHCGQSIDPDSIKFLSSELQDRYSEEDLLEIDYFG